MDHLLAAVLLVQGILGGFDTLYNHEFVERLRSRPQARRELQLHAVREAIYAILFLGLAWFSWHGAAALAIAALVALEVAVTAFDEAVENRTRVLPQNERVLHVFLTLNLGFLVALLVPVLWEWTALPTGLSPAGHPIALAMALSLLGLSSAAWSCLDYRAVRRLGASPPQAG